MPNTQYEDDITLVCQAMILKLRKNPYTIEFFKFVDDDSITF